MRFDPPQHMSLIFFLEGLIKLSKALHVGLDEMVFEDDERVPDGSMKLMFEAVEQLQQKDQDTIKELLQSMISRYESKRFTEVETL